MQRLKRCDQFAEKKRKKEWTALDGFCSKTVDVTPIVKAGISSSHTQIAFLAYLIFFPTIALTLSLSQSVTCKVPLLLSL